MKKIVSSFFVITSLSCSERTPAVIVPYDSAHKEAVLEIAFQDKKNLFASSVVLARGLMSVEQFDVANEQYMENFLGNPLFIKKVLLDTQKVAGFIGFFRGKEPSLESFKKKMQACGQRLPDDTQLLAAMPELKKTDAECASFAQIELLAVSQAHRRLGYGKALMQDAIVQIKTLWPDIEHVQLNVRAGNAGARTLYEHLAFALCAHQPWRLMETLRYERLLK